MTKKINLIMFKSLIRTLLILVICSGSIIAQKTPKDHIKEFFERYKNESISIAIDSLYATNKWVSKSSDMIIQLKSKMVMDLENEDYIGKMHGYEPIVMKYLGDSYKLYSYLVKYDRQPIRFTFHFYKPNDKWLLYSFKYDGELSSEIEEAAKAYYEVNRY